MAVEELTTEDLDYIQRIGFSPPPLPAGGPATTAPPDLRRLLRIEAVGRVDRERARADGKASHLLAADLLVGLSNYHVPLVFACGADGARSTVEIGTWLPPGGAPEALGENERILRAALQTLFPLVELTEGGGAAADWPLGGIVLGMPTAKPADVLDGALALDRVHRALTGSRWSAVVMAQPVDESVARDLRLRLINEMRSVKTASKLGGVPSPLADHYLEMLGASLANLTHGQGVGTWRTAVYLLGDAESYYRLASVWRGVFSGNESIPEPVRVWDSPDAPGLATAWAMPDPAGDGPVPGAYRHPFEHQTLLTSTQLAGYVHFPNLETSGFALRDVPDFDAVPARPPAEPPSVVLGRVLERGRPTATNLTFDLDHLTRHAFVTGVTGSGKTNTLFHLLRQVDGSGLPFLVVEPAKTEYRALLNDDGLGERLQVFTLGNEAVSPFRLNPFEVPEGVPVGVHLDLLRSVFHVSFGMWTPLPQVLETCLHRVYVDRGWDITADRNRRLGPDDDRALAFPTLTDLVTKVDEVVLELGYEERVTADLRAALRTRLNSLRTGGKGRMLDVVRSIPFELLLERPTVLELDGMGDDDDKAFVMGLVMIRLAEHRRVQGDVEGLRHLLVIEEAHRLLSNPGQRRDETEADVRGKAVETFANLLTEVRAYGQGVAVVDQVPAKLAPDVIKNSNLKLAHRVVAGDDRKTLAQTMAMTPRQERSLTTLAVGQAAMFADGEDAPLLLQVPKSKGGSGTWPDQDAVRGAMQQHALLSSPTFVARTPACDEHCAAHPDECDAAGRLADEAAIIRTLRRVVLSAIETQGGIDRTWPDLVIAVEALRPPWTDRDALLRCVAVHGAHALAARRGALAGWSYAATQELAQDVAAMLLTHLEGGDAGGAAEQVRLLHLALQGERYGPFPRCARIWGGRDGACLCRYPVAEMVRTGGLAEGWGEARRADAELEEGGRPATWAVCQDAAYHLVEFPRDEQDPDLGERLSDVARATALCFAQQMLSAEAWSHPDSLRRIVDELIEESGHE